MKIISIKNKRQKYDISQIYSTQHHKRKIIILVFNIIIRVKHIIYKFPINRRGNIDCIDCSGILYVVFDQRDTKNGEHFIIF